MAPNLAERFGVVEKDHLLLANLKKLAIRPEEIDFVVLSHLHFDHAGGLLPSYEEIEKGNDKIVFPNAKIVVGEEAYERSLHPHPRDKASFIPLLSQQLQSLGDRLIVVAEGSKVDELPEIEFRFSHGHTPGQMHSLIRGKRSPCFSVEI